MALTRRLYVAAVTQIGDPGVAVLEKMLSCLGRTMRVVTHNRIGFDPDWLSIYEHKRGSIRLLGKQVALALTDHGENQAVDPSAEKRFYCWPFPIWFIVDTRSEDSDVSSRGRVLDCPIYRRSEWVSNARHNQTDGLALTTGPPEASRSLIWAIAQLSDGFSHPIRHIGRDERFVIDDARNSLYAYSGQCCDVFHRGPARCTIDLALNLGDCHHDGPPFSGCKADSMVNCDTPPTMCEASRELNAAL
jgi:hypothetical protein